MYKKKEVIEKLHQDRNLLSRINHYFIIKNTKQDDIVFQ